MSLATFGEIILDISSGIDTCLHTGISSLLPINIIIFQPFSRLYIHYNIPYKNYRIKLQPSHLQTSRNPFIDKDYAIFKESPMSDKPNGKSKDEDVNTDTENLLYFPELEKRNKRAKNKKKEEAKLSKKGNKEQEKLEDEYRRQYRAEQASRAKMQAGMARHSASGKTPFINWDKIPPFTRVAVIAFVLIHLVTTFLIDDAQRVVLYMNFGFVPAYYSGAIPWVWSALIAPFTTALLHGGWMHLLTNCVMMAAMGVFFERQFGLRITLIFFVFSLMSGNLVYFILNPAATTPVIGASGAISGLFGAVILMMNFSGIAGAQAQKRGPFPFILLWVTVMIVVGLISSDTAWQSHLGGFLGGIGLFQLWRKGKVRF